MPHRVRGADRFKTQSAEQLVTGAGAVIPNLMENLTGYSYSPHNLLTFAL
jgi:hypothetical protein